MELKAEKWMNEEMRKVYDTVLESLSELRDIEAEDHYLIVDFATNYVLFTEETEKLMKQGTLLPGHNGSLRRNPLIMSRNTFQTAFMDAAKALGLGAAQRQRLKFEKEKREDKDPTNPLNI